MAYYAMQSFLYGASSMILVFGLTEVVSFIGGKWKECRNRG
ncbi:hypothetical protein [Diplocloster agilis]|nr:hypothetical protein [Diplocloster agilis]